MSPEIAELVSLHEQLNLRIQKLVKTKFPIGARFSVNGNSAQVHSYWDASGPTKVFFKFRNDLPPALVDVSNPMNNITQTHP